MRSVPIWTGEYGEYPIPPLLRDTIPMTKSGYPDKRYKKEYAKFMAWVAEQENKAKAK
jgi:hypothetical protein